MGRFNNWVKWTERNSIVGKEYPGVYLLARFKGKAPLLVDERDENIVYIGETCNSLSGRWRKFHSSAFLGKRGHSGGSTYKKKYNDKGNRLYVGMLAVKEKDKNKYPLYIRYIERKLIWRYARKWGKAPSCNTK